MAKRTIKKPKLPNLTLPKICQGHSRVIIWTNYDGLESQMLHTKFRGNRSAGFRDDFWRVFTIHGRGGHLGNVARMPIRNSSPNSTNQDSDVRRGTTFILRSCDFIIVTWQNLIKMAAATRRKPVIGSVCVFCGGGGKRLSCFVNNKLQKTNITGFGW